MKLCLIVKKSKPKIDQVIELSKKHFNSVDVFFGDSNDLLPRAIFQKEYDVLISYISPWIIPNEVLKKTKKWNINFHPGPPEYPGIGCFNFALFDNVSQFGSTAHIMNSKVDTGKIIAVNRFNVSANESVLSLSLKTYESLFFIYEKVIKHIKYENALPKCSESWQRKPFTRKDLEKLSTIKIDMSESEIEKIINATYYPGMPAPFIELNGKKFEYNPER